jgi:hypothetical protein
MTFKIPLLRLFLIVSARPEEAADGWKAVRRRDRLASGPRPIHYFLV